jgi:ABC-type glycerol-3-phosphate transport system substrate-binding protein
MDIWAITTVEDLNAEWAPDPNNEEFKKQWWTGGMIRLQAKPFLEKHPGVTLKITGHSWDWDLRQNEYLALAAGITPDTGYGEAYVTEFAILGVYAPVSETVADLFAPGTLRAQFIDGVHYGLSETTGANVLFINNNVLKKAGLDPAKKPETWDQWLADAQAVSKANNDPKWGNNAFFTYLAEQESIGSILRIAGLFESNNTPIGSDIGVPTINTPGAADVWVFLNNMLHTSNNDTLLKMEAGGEIGSVDGFNNGVIAYKISWTNDATTVGTDADVDVDAVQMPIPAGGKHATNLVGNQINSPFKNGPNPELAIDYIETSCSDVAAQEFKPNGCGIWIPSLKSILENYETYDKLGGFKSDVSKKLVRVTMQAALDPGTGPIPGWPKNGGRIWNAWNDMYSRIWKGNLDKAAIQAELDTLQTTVEGLVKKSG